MSRTKRKADPVYGSTLDTTRDKKKWYKPTKTFKKLRKAKRRAKTKQAVRTNNEVPLFKKTDVWDWN